MKALNRAIARTVSQINRITTPDDYYLPLLDKLTSHLDALLTMERKMLEGVQEVAGPVISPSLFTQAQVAALKKGLKCYSKEDDPPAPDVINMTDPANWQVGDVVVRIAPTFGPMFDMGHEYVVSKIDAAKELVYINTNDELPFEYPFGLLRRDPPFQWLRHG